MALRSRKPELPEDYRLRPIIFQPQLLAKPSSFPLSPLVTLALWPFKKCTKLQWLSYGFSSGHVQMWELDYKESWAPKNWCFWSVVLEKTLESPLDCKEIQPVHPKGDQSWMFIEGLMLKLQYFSHLMGRADSLEIPEAGKDWRQKEKREVWMR